MTKATSRKTIYDHTTGEAMRTIETVEIDGLCVEETITEYEPEVKPAKKRAPHKKAAWSSERRARYEATMAERAKE